MGRIIGIDYGKKRCGIAVTDPLQIIATPLTVVSPKELIYFLKQYIAKEPVEAIVVGMALNDDGSETDSTTAIKKFIRNCSMVFPQIPLHTIDEAYSSQQAAQEIAAMKLSKTKREEKGLIDEIAATLLLRTFLEGTQHKSQ